MKVTPVASPHQITDGGSSNPADAKARAVAKFMQGTEAKAPTQAPVLNQNAISVEELGAITPQAAPEAEVEPKAPEAEAEVKPEAKDPLSSQYALLARKEKALRAQAQQRDQALKAKEAALQVKEEALKAKEQEYATGYIQKSKFKQNPMEALSDAEVTYEEVTQAAIDAQNVNPQVSAHIKRLEAKLAKLEEQAELQTKASAEQQSQQYQAAVKQIRNDAAKLVNSDPSFETIKATGSVKEVVELIEQNFKETGEVMSVEEAATEVENHLMEEIEKLMKIEKIKKRQESMNASSKPVQTQTPTPKQPQMKTLTNASSSTRTLSAKERAILAFKGELKA